MDTRRYSRFTRRNTRPTGYLSADWPTSAGASFWFDPSTGYTIDTGVDSWTDRIGSFNTANVTDAQQPAFAPTGLAGGKPGFTFAKASSQKLIGGAPLAALFNGITSYSLFYRLKANGLTLGADAAIGAGTVASSTTDVLVHGYGNGSAQNRDYVARGATTTTGTIDWGLTGEHTVSLTFNGTHVSVWLDGVLAINNLNATQSLACDLFVFGARRRLAAYDLHLSGTLGDVVYVPGALSTPARQDGEAWFTARYA